MVPPEPPVIPMWRKPFRFVLKELYREIWFLISQAIFKLAYWRRNDGSSRRDLRIPFLKPYSAAAHLKWLSLLRSCRGWHCENGKLVYFES
jgi:hypothetical protein